MFSYLRIFLGFLKMASDGYSHQDWKEVIMKRPKSETATVAVAKGPPATTAVGGKPAWKVEQQVDSDNGKPLNYVGTDTARSIVGGRTAAKLTQKQLAQRLNVPEKDIKDIEAGKALENRALLARIKRALNM